MASFGRVFSDKRLVLIPLVALALANVVMLGLVLGPLGGRVGTLEDRATAASTAAATAERELDDARALATGKVQATDDLQRFYRDVLPADQASARRLTFLRLAQVARGAGLDFDRRAFTQDHQRDAHLVRADLSMIVRGRYDQLRRFMYDVEAGDDFVVIRSLTVINSGDIPGDLEATLSLSTYYKADDGQ